MMSRPQIELFGLRRNALVMTATSFILGIGRVLGFTFLSLYALHLGAPIHVLGLFSTIQGLISIFLVAPIGYLSDVIGHRRKWIIVAGDALSALAYFIYASARSWVWLIPGIMFETSFQLIGPVGTAIVSDNINPDKRGIAIATRSLTIMLPNTFMPVLGGILLDSIGMEQGMPFLFTIAGLARITGTLGRAIFLKEAKSQVPMRSKETYLKAGTARIKGTVSDMFRPLLSTKSLQTMAIISCLGAIGMTVLNRYKAPYVTGVIGLTNAEWGLVVGLATFFGSVFRIPLGKLADIFGRRKLILLDYSFRPIYFIALINAKDFTQILLLNTLYDLSGEAGTPAWQALIMDVTPRGMRGRVQGSFSMVRSATMSIFPTVAGFLWVTYGPTWSFYMCALAEALAVLAIYLFLKEPKQRER